jgi:heptosyltransferase II
MTAPRILCTHTGGGMGDLLLATPVLAALKRRFPASAITCWAHPAHAPILVGNPSVDRIWTADPDGPWRTLLAELRSARYDLAVLPWTNTRQAWLTALADIPRRVGPSSRMQYGFLFTDRVWDRTSLGDVTAHVVQLQLDFAAALDCDTSGLAPSITLTPAEKAAAEALLEGHGLLHGEPYCVLHAGRGLDLRGRGWPAGAFGAIGRRLHAAFGLRIVLTGTAGEAAMVGGVATSIGPAAIGLAGRTDLRQACANIAHARLCVSLDTGPMHVAAALGVPVVALFPMACYPPTRWHPYGVPHRVVRTGAWRCDRRCVKETCPDFRCHDAIDVDAVVRAAGELLARQEIGS